MSFIFSRIKKFFHTLYLIWAAAWFFLTLLVAFVILVLIGKLLPKRRRHPYSNFFLRHWSRLWSFLIGIRYRHFGWKDAYKSLTLIIVTNHNSYLDTIASYIHIRSRFKTLAKKELQKAPLMGPIFLTSGIMVDRGSPEGRKASYQRMVDAVQSGVSIMIFPEGTQNRSQEPLREFYDGAFRLAIETQTPLLPAVIINTRQLMPQARFNRLRPGRAQHHFLEPVPTAGLSEADLPALKDRVRQAMWEKVLAEDPDYPN
ncbi:MAG: lysophospholipid acyltransferase family protein [Bacteroidota bacterium]